MGTFGFIHKADPYWFNRLLFELQLSPEDEIKGEETVGFFELLRAVCHIRFSSKCLSLEDEVFKSNRLKDHMHDHASAIMAISVKGWLAHRHPPIEMVPQVRLAVTVVVA